MVVPDPTLKEEAMYDSHVWQTPNKNISISLCSEGCLHVVVGRAIIKMTPDEFFALHALTSKAARDLQRPQLASPAEAGH